MSDISRPRPSESSRDRLREVVPEWRPSPALAALDELVQVAGQMPHDVARQAGISTTELHALRHLSQAEMGPVDLARALGVTSAASSGVVDRLVARGHVERRPHPDDGRRTTVVLTESGSAELFQRLAPMFSALAELDAALTDGERDTVARYLEGATDALRRVQ
ncbi:MAG: MarR family winged helix-turn-helix transcriptional regulator [Dermatophilaceae bacterium]